MTPNNATYDPKEIELRKSLRGVIEGCSPYFWDKPLAQILSESKYRFNLATALVTLAIRDHSLAAGTGIIDPTKHLPAAKRDDAALNRYLDLRRERGPHERGKNPPDSDLALLAAPWHSKRDRAANYIRALCYEREVPRELWPKQNKRREDSAVEDPFSRRVSR